MAYLLTASVTFLAMLTQAAVGFGFAFVLAPYLLATRPAASAVLLVLLLGIVINLLILFGERRRREVKWQEIRPLLVGTLPGMVLGAYVLQTVSKPVLQVSVGITVLVGALVELLERRKLEQLASRSAGHSVGGFLVGLLAGVLTTATSISGPVLILWLLVLQVSATALRDTINVVFLWLNVVGIAILLFSGAVPEMRPTLTTFALLVPVVVAGHAVGAKVFRGIKNRHYEKAVLLGLLVIGVATVLSGII